MNKLHIFAPATVANVSCGFDAMGFALENLGDEMVITKTAEKRVVISKIEGADLPFEPRKNSAAVVAQKMLEDNGFPFGVSIELYKKYKPGSGLGSSAASSAGAAFAINRFLGNKYEKLELVKYAMLGEDTASGAQIADNVGASLYGGFVLIKSYSPLEIVPIPTPSELYVTVIHPQIEIKTEDARAILPESVPLKTAIAQWANVGALISGLHTADYELIGRSLVDNIVEPARKSLIPHFDALRDAAVTTGALGAGISGSGPSVFALSKGKDMAEKVSEAFRSVYEKTDIDFQIYVSSLSGKGVRVIKEE